MESIAIQSEVQMPEIRGNNWKGQHSSIKETRCCWRCKSVPRFTLTYQDSVLSLTLQAMELMSCALKVVERKHAYCPCWKLFHDLPGASKWTKFAISQAMKLLVYVLFSTGQLCKGFSVRMELGTQIKHNKCKETRWREEVCCLTLLGAEHVFQFWSASWKKLRPSVHTSSKHKLKTQNQKDFGITPVQMMPA